MATFQKAALGLAMIILIILLIVIGMFLSKAPNKEHWPPMVGDCPDYWIDMSGNGAHCVNTKGLGTCKTGKDEFMDFTQPEFTGSNGNCAKAKWANQCGVQWDGLTYGVPNPCS
jgi:hypothetical protein